MLAELFRMPVKQVSGNTKSADVVGSHLDRRKCSAQRIRLGLKPVGCRFARSRSSFPQAAFVVFGIVLQRLVEDLFDLLPTSIHLGNLLTAICPSLMTSSIRFNTA